LACRDKKPAVLFDEPDGIAKPAQAVPRSEKVKMIAAQPMSLERLSGEFSQDLNVNVFDVAPYA
jgi:hypothetical protein